MKISELYEDIGHDIYYHVTPENNVSFILKEGLDPQQSETGRVYLYKSLEDVKDAIGDSEYGYLSDKFPGDFLAVLQITVPHDSIKISPHMDAAWEFVTTDHIPPEYISLLKVYK